MICCIGDLHIDAMKKNIPTSVSLVLATLDSVIDREVEKGATHIVLLGDIFDSAYPAQEDISALIESLRRHPDIPKLILMGNHDYADVKNHALRLVAKLCKWGFINGKVFIKPTKYSIDGEDYLFSPHPYIIDNPPKVRYCFGHFGFDGAKGDSGYVLKSKNHPKGRWILGDYHTAQKGKTYIYPGSLTQIAFHEQPEKYIIRLNDRPELIRITPKLVLGRTKINSEEDLIALEPTTYWSVNITRKAKLPPDWATKYPQVVRHHTEKTVSKRQQVLMQNVASEDPLAGIDDYLRSGGLNDKQVARCMSFLGR